jgi:hypothetical protein
MNLPKLLNYYFLNVSLQSDMHLHFEPILPVGIYILSAPPASTDIGQIGKNRIVSYQTSNNIRIIDFNDQYKSTMHPTCIF